MNKKIKSLKRILYCAENNMINYRGTYRDKSGNYCAIGCLFTDKLINWLIMR